LHNFILVFYNKVIAGSKNFWFKACCQAGIRFVEVNQYHQNELSSFLKQYSGTGILHYATNCYAASDYLSLKIITPVILKELEATLNHASG
jgi:hypothetical protein